MSNRSTTPPRQRASTSSERYVIPNLRNACRILKFLADSPEPLKAAEIGRVLSIPVTTTLRIMTTLHLEGLVRKHGNNYELGPVLIRLGSAALSSTEIRVLAMPVLEKLTARARETSHLATLYENRTLIIAVKDSPHPLRAASRPGFLTELYCSSTGKTFLAFKYRNRLKELFGTRKLEARTPRTITTLAGLRADCELTRKRGFSLDNEEFHPGVRCLAAPVFDADRIVTAAIGITASTLRFTEKRIPEMSSLVKAAAAELSKLLGYPGAKV